MSIAKEEYLISRLSGQTAGEFVAERKITPIGLQRLRKKWGIPDAASEGVALEEYRKTLPGSEEPTLVVRLFVPVADVHLSLHDAVRTAEQEVNNLANCLSTYRGRKQVSSQLFTTARAILAALYQDYLVHRPPGLAALKLKKLIKAAGYELRDRHAADVLAEGWEPAREE